MENYFLPILGGTLIGGSAVLLMLLLGKIAGISGIFWGMFTSNTILNDRLWRVLFIISLPIGALLAHSVLGMPAPMIDEAPYRAALAGLLVGIGIKLSSGCTSGHGVCGISRFSIRSLVATLTFMLTAILLVTFTH